MYHIADSSRGIAAYRLYSGLNTVLSKWQRACLNQMLDQVPDRILLSNGEFF
jgi:hypothetical protein